MLEIHNFTCLFWSSYSIKMLLQGENIHLTYLLHLQNKTEKTQQQTNKQKAWKREFHSCWQEVTLASTHTIS